MRGLNYPSPSGSFLDWKILSRESSYQPEQTVPVVLYSGPCLFRTMLLATLKAHKREWQTVYSASSIADLTAAVRANLGFSVLLESEVDEQIAIVDDSLLPSLPDVDAVVYVNNRERREVDSVVSILGDVIFAEQAQ